MEEAGEHGAGRHGGGTAGCQMDLMKHTNSYVENLNFCRGFFMSDGR
jgi:hypothetical protein